MFVNIYFLFLGTAGVLSDVDEDECGRTFAATAKRVSTFVLYLSGCGQWRSRFQG